MRIRCYGEGVVTWCYLLTFEPPPALHAIGARVDSLLLSLFKDRHFIMTLVVRRGALPQRQLSRIDIPEAQLDTA